MSLPLVAIIGRPNVWKSSLFNRLVWEKISIVSDIAWTTRDRLFSKVTKWVGIPFIIVDTWGLEFDKKVWKIENDMQTQARVAIDDADVVLFISDSKTEPLPQDFEVANLLRKKWNTKPIIFAISKCDDKIDLSRESSFYKLWFWKPIQISAIHKNWISDLLDLLNKTIKDRGFRKLDIERKDDNVVANIAFVGRPNVWKSSLINAFLNKDQLIVSDVPWTTRDAVDSLVKYDWETYNIIDTAWVRRAWKIEKWIEKYSVLRTIKALDRADIACILIDSEDWITSQDLSIISLVLESKTWLMIIVNKWDLQEKWEEALDKFIWMLRYKMPFIPWAPAVFLSAITTKWITKIFPIIKQIVEERNKRITTGKLNNFIAKITNDHVPTGTKRIRPKIFYMTQVEINPPRFNLFVNKEAYFHFSYFRYLENRLREHFWFAWTVIDIEIKERKSLYQN